MEALKKLNEKEKEMLLKAPAYISLLAANSDGKMDETEKKTAIKISHIKTYFSNPLLANFFKEAEKKFIFNIEHLENLLPKEKSERDRAIKHELEKLEPIYLMLGKEFASLIHNGLQSYAEHVSKAHWNVFAYMLYPLAIFHPKIL